MQPQSFTLLRFSQRGGISAPQNRLDQGARRQRVRRQAGRDADEDRGHADRRRAGRPCRRSPSCSASPRTNGGSSTLSPTSARGMERSGRLRKECCRNGKPTGRKVHLVNCVDRARPNLAIVSLEPAEGIRAAGVPWFMEVAVRTSAPRRPRTSRWRLGEDGHGRPAVTLAEIPPGKTAKERFQVQFSNRPARTRSPPGWKATPWRPTTTAIARSTCRPTCRCCWSTATRRPGTPAI